VLALLVVGGLALRGIGPELRLSTMQLLAFIESATAATASAVALLSILVARMSDDRHLLIVGRTWSIYALVVMPLTAVSDAEAGPGSWSTATAAATAAFLVLLTHATWGFPLRWGHRVRIAWLALLGVGLAALAGLRLPVAAVGAAVVDSADVVCGAGWALLAGWCVARGWRRAEPLCWRMGLGLGLLAAGQLLAVGGAAALPEFPTLRLLGFVVLTVVLVQYAREVVLDRRDRDAERAEQEAVTAHAEAQRSHEIRNALSNLSAITTLLARPDDDRLRPVGADDATAAAAAAPGSLNEIISSEFARLHSLLESSSAGHDAAGTPVDRVLTRLVTLRRLTGSAITLSCPPGLVTAAPAATLAQVVTNLLANCDRHAPGAEVHVSARRTPGACVIEVTDAGPGLLALRGETATTGSGLGLELSSQLVHEFGGTLQLMPATRFPTGTTARLCLPLGGDGDSTDPRRADLERVS
jgi:two-component system OmpR family sensor kinase